MKLLRIVKSLFLCSFDKAKNKEIANIINGMSKAKQLYKDLIIEAHPDRHPHKKEIAHKITVLINENRYNYNALVELKKMIEREL